MDVIRSFAGPEYETAIVAEEAGRVLLRIDERLRGYETAVET